MRALILLVAVGPVMSTSPAQAQEFTDEQLEVWRAVEECQGYYAAEDAAASDACTHEDFTGWLYGEAVPRSKASNQLATRLQWEELDTYGYDLRPLQIRVYGDVAIVHYHWIWMYIDADGVVTTDTGRWTDILLNEGGRWVWIADHGGSTAG